jgi:hypothetical protein
MIAKSRTFVAAMTLPLLASGCYVVPMNPEGTAHMVVAGGTPPPAVLQARLYPANELASETGVLTGTVANMMTGKGRLQLSYRGELLSGEATRVPGEERRGVASAYGQRGTFITCEYQMNTPYQGTGICTVSNGARYQAHIGS